MREEYLVEHCRFSSFVANMKHIKHSTNPILSQCSISILPKDVFRGIEIEHWAKMGQLN